MSCCCHCCCRCCWLIGIQIRIHLVAKTVALARAGGNYGLKFALSPRYKLPWLTLRAVWPCRSSSANSANCGNSANCAICEWANIKYYRAPTWAFNQHDRVRGSRRRRGMGGGLVRWTRGQLSVTVAVATVSGRNCVTALGEMGVKCS